MMMTRRSFMQTILIAGVAPAIVRAESIMRICAPKEIILPSEELIVPTLYGARVFTAVAMSMAEADAKLDGLVVLRRYIDYRGQNLVDFALPQTGPQEVKKIIL